MFLKMMRVSLVLASMVVNGGLAQAALAQQEAPEAPAAFSVNSNLDLGDVSPGNGVCAASNGQCTLRAAVEEANAQAGANEINIPAMTIVLTTNQELRINNGPSDDSLTINGAGQGQTIIDGNANTRIFYFSVFSGTHAISNLTIRNAYNRNSTVNEVSFGGGIFNEATLTLTNVTVTGCRAFQGGGVYNQYQFTATGNVPRLILRNVTLTGNQSHSTVLGYGGGALFNGGYLDGDQVSIIDNRAESQGGGFNNNSPYNTARLTNFEINNNRAREGGGIDNDVGNLTLENGEVANNLSFCCHLTTGGSTGAGGVYNRHIMSLNNVAVYGNVANSPQGYGGGIYSGGSDRGGTTTLTNVSVIGNRAAYGAGIYNGHPTYLAVLNLTNVTISGNTATELGYTAEGGGILNNWGGRAILRSTTIARNHAQITGGIENRAASGYVELRNTILSDNTDEFDAPDCSGYGAFTSLGNNLIGDADGKSSPTYLRCTFNSLSSDQLFQTARLGPLLLDGHHYLPLMPGSTAIDRGTNTQCPATDTIGTPRPFGTTCDIGAFEYTGPLDFFMFYLPFTVR
jgi:hypothetical protein